MEQMNRKSQFTFLSLNVRGIRDKVKRRNIFEWCKSKGSDVVFLQETYSTVEVEERWKLEWDGQIIFSHGSNHSKGVMVLISSNSTFNFDNVVKDNDGRYILLKGELQGSPLLLGNCYFPTRDKEKMQNEFLEKLDACISKLYHSDMKVLLGGDFNTIMNGELDYMGPKTVLTRH